MRIISIILFFCLLMTPSLSGQNYYLEQISALNFSKNTLIHTMDKDGLGFLWIGTNTGLYRYDGVNFERFPNIGSEVKNLAVDDKSNLWLTSNSGLIYISPLRDTVRHIDNTGIILKIRKNTSGNIFGLSNEGIIYHLKNNGKQEEIIPRYNQDTISCIPFNDLYVDQNNNFWLESMRNIFAFSEKGEYWESLKIPAQADDFMVRENKVIFTNFASYGTIEFDLNTRKFSNHEISSSKLPEGNMISAVFEDEYKNLIFSYYRRLFFYNDTDSKITDLSFLFNKNAPEHTFVYDIISSSENSYFLGTNSGLFRLDIIPQKFKTITKSDISPNIGSQFFSIRNLYVKDNSMYISSYSGFYKLDLATLNYKPIQYFSNRTKKFYNPYVYDMIWNEDEFIIASETSGLMRYDESEDLFLNLLLNEGLNYKETTNLEQPRFYAITKEDNKFLLGSDVGIYEYKDKELNKINTNNISLNNSRIYDIEKVDGNIFLGSSDGLYKYQDGLVSEIRVFDDKKTTINYIYGGNHTLWLGTRGDGLIKYDLKTGKSVFYGYDQGLIDLTINGIIYGIDGGLWFSTNLGVSKIDTNSNQIRHFFTNNELEWNEFNHNAICSDPQGNLYFGGIAGIVYFDPREMIQKESPSTLLVTKITKRDGESKDIVTENFNRNKLQQIDLEYNDRFFSVEFAKSNLFFSQSDQFQYRIAGREWIDIGNSRIIQFTDLNPGEYLLEIAGSNEQDSNIKSVKIPIRINQVYYKQWWAIVIYGLSLLGLISWIFRNLLIRSKLQSKLNLEQSYSRQLQELADTKSQIFSNLAHEFQTPLTLIQGPAAKIEESTSDPSIVKWSRVIVQNAQDLMEMIQQMLKLSRMDEGLYALEWKNGDLLSFLKEVSLSFLPLCEEKQIKLNFTSNREAVYCQYDEDKIGHILKNILSNAIKFTPAPGSIHVNADFHLNDEEDLYQLILTVEDSGIGISKDNANKIFERFYQSDGSKTRQTGGTGIGLSLVKEFVDILNGTIKVDSEIGNGTVFTVSFDFEKSLETNQIEPKFMAMNPEQGMENGFSHMLEENKEYILLVEDNKEVRDFIKDCLNERFIIIEANDGKEGLEKAISEIPDLIITDVMMPIMDGYTMVKKLKENQLSVHTPCVMLTAKSNDDDRLQGRKSGAEAFLAKPFMPEELNYVVDNLLRLRKNSIENNKQKANSKIADPFIQHLLELISKEIDNPNLHVKQITKNLTISRTQLHRKIKALTGKSINQFIREYRLEKAKEMLESGNYNVNEVCYQVGFTQPSYFAARFKEYFGKLPSDLLD